jgi:hypothetical protein
VDYALTQLIVARQLLAVGIAPLLTEQDGAITVRIAISD